MQNTGHHSETGFRLAGFGDWESRMLEALIKNGECTSTELADTSGLAPYKISLTAKKLVGMGLAHERTQPRSRRGNGMKVYSIAVPPKSIRDVLVELVSAEVGGM